jgi:hypothetical protein
MPRSTYQRPGRTRSGQRSPRKLLCTVVRSPATRPAILVTVKRAAVLVWALVAVGLAVVLVIATLVGSLLNSCGAGNHGPNVGAEEEFCGYGSGEPTDYSALFVFVQLIPAIPVLVGALLSGLGHSRLFFAAGVALGVLSTALIWALEP